MAGPESDRVRAGALLCRVVDGFTNTTESGTRGGLEAARLLGSIGLKVAGDGLLVSNRGAWLHQRLEDRWPNGRWKSLLRDLPDARPTPPKYFAQSLTSRATSVPLRLLTHTVIGALVFSGQESSQRPGGPRERMHRMSRRSEARKQAPCSVPGGMDRRSLRRRRPVSRVDPIRGPEADKLADQCIRMRRFIDEQSAVLAANVSVLATVTGWEADDTWDWVARQAERERCSQ